MESTVDYINIAPRFDHESNRWRDGGGKFITPDAAEKWFAQEQSVFSRAIHTSRTPISDNLAKIEGINRLTALSKYSSNETTAADGQKVRPIPSKIYSAMALSEYYMETEGDLAQTVIAPMEIAIGNLIVQGINKKNVQQVEELVKVLYLDEIASEIYYCMEVYGQAYPLESWDGKRPESIQLLDPKSIWQTGQNYAEVLGLQKNDAQFYVHPEFNPNSIQPGEALPVPPDRMRAVYSVKTSWQRYATPPMRRAFRPLGTRQILDEMVRATIEGAKNQLWVFKVGTDKLPADPRYITYLKDLIEGGNQDRTGQLVWTHDLVVEQHIPKPIDTLLANEKYVALTNQIMINRGLSVEIVSGSTTSGQSSRDVEIDTQVLMGRLKNRRRRIESWLEYLMSKVGNANGWARDDTPVIRFSPIEVDDTLAIQKRLKPLYDSGALSVKTFLTDAGYDYEAERVQKDEELSERQKWVAPISYMQGVVGKDVAVETPKAKVLAKVIAEWREEIPGMWGMLMRGEIGSNDFYEWMKTNSDQSLETAYREGYGDSGGQLEIDEAYMKRVLDWNIDHLNRYVIQIDQTEDPEKLAWRAPLYESEGVRKAYIFGMFQAMIEHGAIAWQRVLHPELSQSGPCEWCIADSEIIHPMTDTFTDHPYGVCSVEQIRFYRDYLVPLLLPVPKRYGRVDQTSYKDVGEQW